MSRQKTLKLENVFTGTIPKKIDLKSRTGIPAPFRSLLPKNDAMRVWVVKGRDKIITEDDKKTTKQDKQNKTDKKTAKQKEKFGYLEVWPAPDWEAFCNDLLQNYKGSNLRKIVRQYVSQASECKIDKEGRIIVPPLLKDYAKLKGEILWIGNIDFMELWAKDVFGKTDSEREQANSYLDEWEDREEISQILDEYENR